MINTESHIHQGQAVGDPIVRGLQVLLQTNAVAELRVLQTRRGTLSGYFDNLWELAKAAAHVNGTAPGVYVTLNPVRPDLLARSANRVREYAKHTTSDADVLSRRWFAIDFDPVRPSGISSTDAEHEAALDRARLCRMWLHDLGWPDPVFADSGNGAHLLYRVELPNDSVTTDLVKNCLAAIGLRFSDNEVNVDPTTFNAARIWKVYGTLAAKGDNTPQRPHRYARVVESPKDVQAVDGGLLAELAATLPPVPKRHNRKTNTINVAAWLEHHDLPVVSESAWNGGRKWVLNPCPWNAEHTNKAAFVVQFPNGAVAAGCHHASCAGNDWSSLRDMYEKPASRSSYDERPDDAEERANGKQRQNQATALLLMADDAELFHTPDGEAYAALPVDTHKENCAVRSRQFRNWLSKRFYEETGSAPSAQALQDAIGVFESRAKYDGPEHPVYVRLAESNGKIYLDLANRDWEVVEVDTGGWRTASSAPVKFRRTRGMRPLPHPEQGGTVDALRDFINIGSESDWVLLVAWLLAAFRPTGPYPVAVLHGEQGSCKSTAAKVLRALIDPNTAPLRSEPKDVRDVMIAASNAWVVALDNLSRIHPWLSDALCRLATGGGFATRELYSDSDEALFEAQRPCILNGIEELATRGDLLDRSLVIYLPVVPEAKRRAERDFWAEFELAQPRIVGALLSVVSSALGRLPNAKLDGLPRLADFALWATASEQALGWPDGTFMAAYSANRSSANDLALEVSPIAPYLRTVAEPGWEGTANELLEFLTSQASEKDLRQPGWPKTPRSLSGALRRLAPNLRATGIEVEFGRDQSTKRNRIITITKKTDALSATGTEITVPNNQLRSVRHAEPMLPEESTLPALDSSDANIPMLPAELMRIEP